MFLCAVPDSFKLVSLYWKSVLLVDTWLYSKLVSNTVAQPTGSWITGEYQLSLHTSYLSRTRGRRPCKFFLAGVNFYRFNAKNWHFRQILREKVASFTDLTRKIGVFRCKFYSPKMTNIRYASVWSCSYTACVGLHILPAEELWYLCTEEAQEKADVQEDHSDKHVDENHDRVPFALGFGKADGGAYIF